MAKTLRTHLDGGKAIELRNMLEHLLSADPGSPAEGQHYYNTTSHRPKFYCGATDGWQTLAVLINKLSDFAAPNVPLSMGSQKIVSMADGTAATDGATYGQLLALINGLDWKNSVRVATTGALPSNTRTGNVLTATANGTIPTQDGVTLVANDSILVKDEGTAANNGIYVVTDAGTGGTPWILTRRSDADSSAEVSANTTVSVSEGTANADKWFQITTNDAITLNTTALTFAQIGQGNTYLGGAGLVLTGLTFDIVAAAGSGIVVNADNIDIDPVNGLPVNRGGTGAINAANARNNLGVTGKYSISFGDGAATSFNITHSLNNSSPAVAVYKQSSGALVDTDVVVVDANNITLAFAVAPTSNEFRVGVIG